MNLTNFSLKIAKTGNLMNTVCWRQWGNQPSPMQKPSQTLMMRRWVSGRLRKRVNELLYNQSRNKTECQRKAQLICNSYVRCSSPPGASSPRWWTSLISFLWQKKRLSNSSWPGKRIQVFKTLTPSHSSSHLPRRCSTLVQMRSSDCSKRPTTMQHTFILSSRPWWNHAVVSLRLKRKLARIVKVSIS